MNIFYRMNLYKIKDGASIDSVMNSAVLIFNREYYKNDNKFFEFKVIGSFISFSPCKMYIISIAENLIDNIVPLEAEDEDKIDIKTCANYNIIFIYKYFERINPESKYIMSKDPIYNRGDIIKCIDSPNNFYFKATFKLKEEYVIQNIYRDRFIITNNLSVEAVIDRYEIEKYFICESKRNLFLKKVIEEAKETNYYHTVSIKEFLDLELLESFIKEAHKAGLKVVINEEYSNFTQGVNISVINSNSDLLSK